MLVSESKRDITTPKTNTRLLSIVSVAAEQWQRTETAAAETPRFVSAFVFLFLYM